MGTTGTTTVNDNETTDLYKNQLKYNKYIENKKMVYSILCFIAAVVNIITIFAFPMFTYNVKGNTKTGVKPIKGEYTHTYIIEKYFKNELGERSLFNTTFIILLFVLIILAVILLIATALNVFAKKLVQKEGTLKKLFSYIMIEIFSTVFLVVLMFAMMCGKIDVSGGAENALGFWIYVATSVVMIFTSIPLSDK